MTTRPTPLKRLSTMAGGKDLSDLRIPTITEDAEDVVGRIRLQKDERTVITSHWMDKQRSNLQAYEYLCHIGEAKEWIEECLGEEIDPIVQLEESMRNGIVLAQLANWFAPGTVRRIFTESRLQFRHSDNINYFFKAIKLVRLPSIFWFELTDLYERKNIPKVIYCIHALSHLLARRNMAPNIKNLVGQLEFTNEEITATQRGLDRSGVAMPNFGNVRTSLRKELNEDDDDDDIHYEPIYMSKISEVMASPTTPDLIEESDSDEEREVEDDMTEEEKSELYWSQPQNMANLIRCQSLARRYSARKEFNQVKDMHKSTWFESQTIKLQAHARGVLCRKALEDKRIMHEDAEGWITNLQSRARGFLARCRYQQKLDHYQANIDKIIKIQSFVKNKLVGDAYRKLTTATNPSVGTVKNFIHLLDDSELDFDQELSLEQLRQKVIRNIRDNGQLETHVNELDIQIALLLQNAITLDEVVGLSRKMNKKMQRRASELAQVTNNNPYSLRSLDKDSRRRLELFQQMFYLLQTEPKYLARLMYIMNGQESADHLGKKLVETTVLTLFGYAQNSREEYLMLKLFKYCIAEEMSYMENTQEFMRGNYIFMKLVVHYNRGAKERKFFRDLLQPLVNSVLEDDFMDLETDPVNIYHKSVNLEESRTGRPSARKHTASSQEALADAEVRDTFIQHLKRLREVTERFLSAIISTLDEMPYGVRFIAMELKKSLEENFPEEPKQNIVKIIGNFIYYRYLNPAIIAPEQYDVVETVITPMQRKNLAEVSKMLQQISSGKVFDANDLFLAPLNDYVFEAGQRFSQWFVALTDVEDAETHFGMDQFADFGNTHKPIVYISPYEVYHMHHIVSNNINDLEPEKAGPLRDILQELGQPLYSPDVDMPESAHTEMSLTLTNQYAKIPHDPNARLKQLLVDTKRFLLYVIKIQNGNDLQAIFTQPITNEHEHLWAELKQLEFQNREESQDVLQKRRFVHLGTAQDPPTDLMSLSFHQLKTITVKLVLNLERCGVISAGNNYQDLIKMIAKDITNKNTRRKIRQGEIQRLQQTLANLQEKTVYLKEQQKHYEGYLDSCMANMVSKRGKKNKFVLPFTRQYFHLRDLQRSGKVPKFGSYKYTAKQLYDRRILLELTNISPKQYDRIPLVISMDQVGIITIEGSYAGWGIASMSVELRFEELLQTQFNGIQTMTLMDGMAKVNVNLLIWLINRKFYV
ncbi:iqgap-related protein [Umbelopsis sp. WA50703]